MNLTEYPESATNLLIRLQERAILLLRPNLLWHLLNIKNIRKMRNRHNPLIPHCPICGEKCLRKKVFIVKTNVIRNNFLEIFEKEKMLKL